MNSHILPFADPGAKIILMFEDEARFGRINDLAHCWCPKGVRPVVPRHLVREFVYAFGAVDPIGGEKCFITAPYCNTVWTSEFLKILSEKFKNDYILMCTDGASWHKSKNLIIPDNIRLFFLPAYTPEMNPTEQIWKEIRKDDFKNVLFQSLKKVEDKLCDSIVNLSEIVIKSVTCREWIASMFIGK